MTIAPPRRRGVERERTVVLNASAELLAVVDLPRAVGYVVLGKAQVVAVRADVVLRSAGGFEMAAPSVVRLVRYVRIPATARVPAWTRAGLLRRDRYTCAYCSGPGDTVEHIRPQSRGGASTWLNTVAACGPCNRRKADRTPAEAGMVLRTHPSVPTLRGHLLSGLPDRDRVALVDLGLVAA